LQSFALFKGKCPVSSPLPLTPWLFKSILGREDHLPYVHPARTTAMPQSPSCDTPSSSKISLQDQAQEGFFLMQI